MSDIGTQIRNERIRQGLSCRGLARKAGVMTKEYMEYMTSDERKLIRHIATKVRDENLIDVDVEAQIMGDYLTYTKLKQEIEKTTEKFLRKMKNE